jgi:hypothetical protein
MGPVPVSMSALLVLKSTTLQQPAFSGSGSSPNSLNKQENSVVRSVVSHPVHSRKLFASQIVISIPLAMLLPGLSRLTATGLSVAPGKAEPLPTVIVTCACVAARGREKKLNAANKLVSDILFFLLIIDIHLSFFDPAIRSRDESKTC